VEKARPQALADHIIKVLSRCDNETRFKAMNTFCERATTDKTKEIERLWNMLVGTPEVIAMVGMPEAAQERARLAYQKALANGK
jgi:hypothetical protein